MAKLRITYPISAEDLVVEGRFMGLVGVAGNGDAEVLYTPMVQMGADIRIRGQRVARGQVLALDPRCLVRDPVSGEVAYNPREHIEQLDRPFVEWLGENPDWPDGQLGAQEGA